jgi:hypothetical protein
MVYITSCSTTISRNLLLVKLIIKLDIFAKTSNIIIISLIFLACVGVTIVVSSMNYKRVVLAINRLIRSG